MIDRLVMPLLRRLDPERSHSLALAGLRAGLGPRRRPIASARLATELAGLALPNPLGLAAGFDKNAVALPALLRAGFGFVEVGAATPLPQPGNACPRHFRLVEDGAAINRYGFNNDGAVAIAARLARKRPPGIVGLNLGANKTSADRAADFAEVLALAGPFIDFATVNVSSPNTERLRDLQGPAALAALLAGVADANADLARPVPIFLKIAPDLGDRDLADIAEVAMAAGIAGIIATNTTTARTSLSSPLAGEAGGLSGRPLFEPSTRVLAKLHVMTDGRMPLVGVGGIASADDAWAKIRAGASALQLYTALAYQGFGLIRAILSGLEARLASAGFDRISDAVGTGAADWIGGAA